MGTAGASSGFLGSQRFHCEAENYSAQKEYRQSKTGKSPSASDSGSCKRFPELSPKCCTGAHKQKRCIPSAPPKESTPFLTAICFFFTTLELPFTSTLLHGREEKKKKKRKKIKSSPHTEAKPPSFLVYQRLIWKHTAMRAHKRRQKEEL